MKQTVWFAVRKLQWTHNSRSFHAPRSSLHCFRFCWVTSFTEFPVPFLLGDCATSSREGGGVRIRVLEDHPRSFLVGGSCESSSFLENWLIKEEIQGCADNRFVGSQSFAAAQFFFVLWGYSG